MSKTIYIIGAGFSVPAGAPIQSQLLDLIFKYSGNEYGNPIQEWKNNLEDFLKNAFCIQSDQISDIALEDIYTPLDKCIGEGASFRGYSVDFLQKIRNQLNSLISIVIDDSILKSKNSKSYADDFVNKLIAIKKKAPKGDQFSIISSNWDTILDNRFFKQTSTNKGIVDYACHTVGIDPYKGMIPSQVAKSKGYYTIKLLKIHGSLNWLKCPNCNRLFVDKRQKIAVPKNILSHSCRICEYQKYKDYLQKDGLKLVPQIILPTFLKSFNEIQFKQIWDQTSKELSEATEIVFIGYSFPQADFELRQLLARYVPDNAKVSAVLYSPNADSPSPGNDENSAEYRYRTFFGKRFQEVDYSGVEEFVNQMKLT